MKLASIKNNSRDGTLCVVSNDLSTAQIVGKIAPTLQAAIERWEEVLPQLQELYDALNRNPGADAFPFTPKQAHSPFPRAYQWVDGSAYVNHVELVRQARGATMPENFWTDPLMYQGGSDSFIGPCDPIEVYDESFGIDFEAEIAVVTDDVPMATHADDASRHIKLLMLVNDVSLRHLIPNEIAKGFGFFHSKPASSFSPVAITPDELGLAWDGKKVNLALVSHLNNELFGQPQAGTDMTFNFPQLIEHAAKTRKLSAGTIIGSGTVSNTDRSLGSSCIAEKRMLEILHSGQAKTDFMHFGDTIKIEMFDKTNSSIFGAIEQTVVKAE